MEKIDSSTKFCHYTSIENARRILSTGTMFLSRLDEMNDKMESGFHPEESNRVYVASFTHSESMSIPMFYLYSGIDGKGCRIQFTAPRINRILRDCKFYPVNERFQRLNKLYRESEYEVLDDWVMYCPRDRAIGYYRKNRKPLRSDEVQKRSEGNGSYFIKSLWWKYESEFRIIVKFKEETGRKRIAMVFPMSQKEQGISLLLGPEIDDNEENNYRDEFAEYGIGKVSRVEKEQIKMDLVKRNRHLLK